MLLAIDIGNTNVTLGIFNGNELSGRWSITTDQNRMGDEYFLIIKQLLEMKNIPLNQLTYWNVDLQEAYFSPKEVQQRYEEINKK